MNLGHSNSGNTRNVCSWNSNTGGHVRTCDFVQVTIRKVPPHDVSIEVLDRTVNRFMLAFNQRKANAANRYVRSAWSLEEVSALPFYLLTALPAKKIVGLLSRQVLPVTPKTAEAYAYLGRQFCPKQIAVEALRQQVDGILTGQLLADASVFRDIFADLPKSHEKVNLNSFRSSIKLAVGMLLASDEATQSDTVKKFISDVQPFCEIQLAEHTNALSYHDKTTVTLRTAPQIAPVKLNKTLPPVAKPKEVAPVPEPLTIEGLTNQLSDCLTNQPFDLKTLKKLLTRDIVSSTVGHQALSAVLPTLPNTFVANLSFENLKMFIKVTTDARLRWPKLDQAVSRLLHHHAAQRLLGYAAIRAKATTGSTDLSITHLLHNLDWARERPDDRNAKVLIELAILATSSNEDFATIKNFASSVLAQCQPLLSGSARARGSYVRGYALARGVLGCKLNSEQESYLEEHLDKVGLKHNTPTNSESQLYEFFRRRGLRPIFGPHICGFQYDFLIRVREKAVLVEVSPESFHAVLNVESNVRRPIGKDTVKQALAENQGLPVVQTDWIDGDTMLEDIFSYARKSARALTQSVNYDTLAAHHPRDLYFKLFR